MSYFQGLMNNRFNSSGSRRTDSNLFDALYNDKIDEIVTHDMKFHLDDVCAVAILKLTYSLNPMNYNPIKITRVDPDRTVPFSNDKKVYVDVGKKYEPQKFYFDHHRLSIERTELDSNGKPIKYASAGLVWKELGQKIIMKLMELRDMPISAEDVKLVFDKVDTKFMTPIDAYDNGQGGKKFTDGSKMFTILDYVICANEESKDKFVDYAFLEITDVIKKMLMLHILNEISNLNTYKSALPLFKRAYEMHEPYVVFDKSVNWREIIKSPCIWKYCGNIYAVIISNSQNYAAIHAVPKVNYGNFVPKITFSESLKRKCRGVLSVHPTGCMCSCNTVDNAKLLVNFALNN